ncbi:signal transduction histidine kinase [Clostridium tetanomorphum]|uniref:histidine kinase n=1 Tax=Clostridium tetanomorphum TaxID=1553 RepID=A0A923IYF6_CLOTT|nr:HAMP domain-containing sensor histidine kinase [Clostridium tetanomorphum]KAJ50974.1 sensory transduction protein kinase [Clostridium tetanomorphum DSM 665]MBC2396341.1 HAMP domain-containing histidine kinase [Clostridium tetanomorphum]MBP1863430.1 signal transduction histidine kinase [Clostridium tetanomorphum]NRS83527.1 signal transduction histidine kinase [Clostridium tetanomorphum]NRZ96727.1 signal transduction histidine kinase [Clostridium tetanomorphum]
MSENILIGIIIILVLIIINLNRNIYIISQVIKNIGQGNYNERIRIQNNNKYLNSLIENLNYLVDKFQNVMKLNKEYEEERKKMISNISHDLRTPLTSLLGYIEFMKDNKNLSEEEREEYIDIIQNKGENLRSLMNEFFQLSKLDSNDIKLDIKEINLSEIIRQNIILFYNDFNKKEIEPVIDLPDEDIYAMGDKKAVERILNNLISNAIKYGYEGKSIGVNLKCNEENVQIIVWDKGKGIPKENLSSIFERLHTLEKSRNKTLQGSGLGLTIVKKLVEMQNGTITAKSTSYKKTEFIFTLPSI